MELTFKTHGNEKQKEVCRAWVNDEVTDIAYGGSKGSGKSYLGCSLIFSDALTYPGTAYFIARKKLNDLRKHTIPSIHEVFNDWGLTKDYYSYNGQDNFFTLYNGSVVYLLDAKPLPSDPLYMRFGSMQITRGWIEEAGEFEEAAKNNLQASIGRWKNDVYGLVGKLLQTCNPSKNYLYRDYYKKNKDKTLEAWKKFIQALPTDNKKLPSGYLENIRRTLTAKEKERLLLGNWEYDDDPSVLCDYDAICDVFTNVHVKPGKKAISADLAMQGRDRFIAAPWDGFICDLTKGVVKAKCTGKEIEEDLKQIMLLNNIGRSQTIVDSDGLGSYLVSYLDGIKEFHAGAKAINEEFANLKSECAYFLADLVNKRLLRIICSQEDKERIIEELEVLKADDIDADEQKKRIIKKDLMKELLGRSPDYLDLLIMRCALEIKYKKGNNSSWASAVH